MTVRVTWVSNTGITWFKDYRISSMHHTENGGRLILNHEGGTQTLLYTRWIISVEEA